MSRHILVAMERTPSSPEALKFALEEYPEATITVLYVLESSDPLDLFGTLEPSEYLIPECGYELNYELIPAHRRTDREQCRGAELVFSQACQLADEYDKELNLEAKSGKTAREIAVYAENNAVDQIVIGDRKHRGVRRALFGNIAASIGRQTSIPVTIVC
jgi:nucleotide-binding universal stress UspA family protein